MTGAGSFHNMIPQDILKAGGVIVKGLILCNKCRKKMDGVCDCVKKKNPEKKGNQKCLIRIYHKGKYYEYRKDDRGFILTYDTAVAKLADIASQIKKGIFNPTDCTDEKTKQRKFEFQIGQWLEERKEELGNGELSPEHYTHIISYNKNYYSYFMGHDVRDIGLETLSNFKREALKYKAGTDERLRSKSKKNILNALHAFFTWLKKNGAIKEIPAFPEIKNSDKTRRLAISREVQAEALQKIPQEHIDPIMFMMKTGIRPGEAIAILVKSVDLNNRVLWVERARSGNTYVERVKNKEALPVPLNDIALSIAKKHCAGKFPNSFFFINPITQKPYTRWFLWDLWKRLSETDVTLYEATRHSFCSQIVPLTDKLTAQRLMRHKDGRSTDNYYHAYADHLLDVVQGLDNAVDFAKVKNEK